MQTNMTQKFSELKIGDTFDFISPDFMLNSFYERCVKISARRYQWRNPVKCSLSPAEFLTARVSNIHTRVYHVNEDTQLA